MRWIARVHLDGATHEVGNRDWDLDDARAQCESWLQLGVWLDRRLHPPSHIIYCEVIEVKE